MARPRKKVGRKPKPVTVTLVRSKLVLPKADFYACSYGDKLNDDEDQGCRIFTSVAAVEEWMRDTDDSGGEYYIYPITHKVIHVTVDPGSDVPPLCFTIRGCMEKN